MLYPKKIWLYHEWIFFSPFQNDIDASRTENIFDRLDSEFATQQDSEVEDVKLLMPEFRVEADFEVGDILKKVNKQVPNTWRPIKTLSPSVTTAMSMA